jgi:hypothetical protein
MKTAVEFILNLDLGLDEQGKEFRVKDALSVNEIRKAKEMEKDKQSKFTINFINWLHLNEYKYNPKSKLYQKHFINETLFFSIDELFTTFKQQEQ